MKKYNISVYPTLLLLNSDGTEFSRVIGGESDPAKFIDTLESISSQKSNIAEKREKFKLTLEGANEFIQTLNDNYLFEERDLALISIYGRRKTSENFKLENFKLYKNLIPTIYHPVALSIMNAGNEAIKFLGKKEYSDFVQSKVDMTLVDMAMRNKVSGEKIHELVTMSKKYKEMQTPLLNYYQKIGNYIDDKNVEAIITFSIKSFKSLSTKDRANIARFTHRIATTNSQIEKMIPFYEHCINVSSTDKEKKKYTDSLNLVKNLLQTK